jgi:hypothetical protein
MPVNEAEPITEETKLKKLERCLRRTGEFSGASLVSISLQITP